MNYAEDCEKQIAVWFKDHVARLDRYNFFNGAVHIEFLEWKKPGTGIYKVNYFLNCTTGDLLITGDMGSAVYKYYTYKTFNDIASDYLSYFQSKCVASENGRENKVWDSDIATDKMFEYLAEDDAAITKEEFKNSDYSDNMRTHHEWCEWVYNGELSDKLIDHYEHLCDIGLVDDNRAIAYLIGIKMAVKQLEEKA